MTKIDFYQIDNEPPLMFACRLIDKIYHQGHQIHVHTGDAEQTEALDQLLWTFRPERFVPHEVGQAETDLAATETKRQVPVRICHASEPVQHQDVLINLAPRVPDFFSRFVRVAELVPVEQNSRLAARANYKFYQDRGYPLDYHTIKSK